MQRVFARLGMRITQRKLGQAVPIVGTIIGAGMNAQLLQSVTDAAHFVYRERFLRAVRRWSKWGELRLCYEASGAGFVIRGEAGQNFTLTPTAPLWLSNLSRIV